MQFTCLLFPIGIACVGHGPGRDFGQQSQTLITVRLRFGLGFFQPFLHKRVSAVARLVKTLPQSVVGLTALVGLFPSLAQLSQAVLQFATGDHRYPFSHLLRCSRGFAFAFDPDFDRCLGLSGCFCRCFSSCFSSCF